MRRKRRSRGVAGGKAATGRREPRGSHGTTSRRATNNASLHQRATAAAASSSSSSPTSASTTNTKRTSPSPRPEEGKRTLRSSNCDIRQSISSEKQPRDQSPPPPTSCDVFMQSDVMPHGPQQTPSAILKENTKATAVTPMKQSGPSPKSSNSSIPKTNARNFPVKEEEENSADSDVVKNTEKSPEIKKDDEKPVKSNGSDNCHPKSESNTNSPDPDVADIVNGVVSKAAQKKKRSVSLSGSSVKSDTSIEDNGGPYMCTYCDEVLDSAHALTSHIRQHNSLDTHTCSLCGKTLSSTSSLDRHMLVHSGERPFKCKLCGMAFTTNGNMHRHMRTHGESDDSGDSSKGSHTTKPKKSVKRKASEDSEPRPSSSPKRPEIEPALPNDAEQEQLQCPVCAKTFLCKYGLQTHMDTHPNDPIYCKECGVTLKNYTHFTEHQCIIPNGKEIEDGKNGARIGFHDLSFVDFSASKFSLIAKTQCEYDARRPSSAFHTFECFKCKKAFPCSSALQLHLRTHTDKTGTYCPTCDCTFQCETHLQAHQLKHRKAEQCEVQDDGSRNCDISRGNRDIPLSNKDDFFALLQLQNRDSGIPLKAACEIKRKEEPFENPSYFIHGKPQPPFRLCDNEEEPVSDFADIQSIISVTSTAALMSSIRSSPIAASPASPVQVSTRTSPESPLVADSANASPDTPSKDDSDHSSENQSDKADDSSQMDDPSAIGGDNYSCKLCNQVFKSSNALKRHNRSHSQGCTLYSCNSCSYTSLDKSTLIRHMRTHNGERPFQCAICKFAFTTKANCERHVRKRHKKLTKQEIKNAMQYNPDMSEHKTPDAVPTDPETRCKYCNVDFKSNRVLRHHLRSLNNSCSFKPYFCSICRLGFSTKNNCIRHVVKQHPGMKDNPSSAVSANAISDTSDQENSVCPMPDGGRLRTLSSSSTPKRMSDSPETSNSSETIKSQAVESCQEQESLAEGLSLPTSMPKIGSPLPIPPPPPLREVSPPLTLPPPVLHLETAPPLLPVQPKPIQLLSPSPVPSILSVPSSIAGADDQPLNLSTTSASEEASQEVDEAMAADGLVSLSEVYPPPQEEPLNLAPHALDLSVKPKTEEPTDLTLTPKPASIFSIPRPAALPSPVLPIGYPTTTPAFRAAPIRPDAVPLHLNPPPPTLCAPLALPPHTAGLDSVYKMTFKMVNQKLSTRSQRSFQCEYCAAGFTLKSNMERHIKRKHPEFARPARSRNFIPSLIQSNSPKQSMPTLSSKTRAALRDVLSNKANSVAKNNISSKDLVVSEAAEERLETAVPLPIPSTSFKESQLLVAPSGPSTSQTNPVAAPEVPALLNTKPPAADDGDSAADLASVSSVIDTANTPAFRKYFGETQPDEKPSIKTAATVTTTKDSPLSTESSKSPEQEHAKISEPSKEDTASHHPTKKRSAYADSPNSVSCPHCPRKFPWSSSLQRHLLTHTGHKPYKCPKCPIYFTTKSNCERHLLRKHGQTREVVRNTERIYKCNMCHNSTFSTPGNLRKHYYLKHWTKTSTRPTRLADEHANGKTDGKMEDSLASAQNVTSISGSLNEAHRCKCCDEVFGTPEDLIGHMQGHVTARFACHVCEGAYKTREECVAHLKEVHLTECHQLIEQVADVTESSVAALNNNNYLEKDRSEDPIEGKPSPVACLFCSKMFWSVEELKKHVKVHTAKKSGFAWKKLQGGNDEDPSVASEVSLPLKKHSQNSLLYMMPPQVTSTPPSSTSTPPSSQADANADKKKDDEGNMDLIQNLLGIHDSSVIEQMLDSPVSAARILGMNKV